jgi:Putative peptidoglycan binding domain
MNTALALTAGLALAITPLHTATAGQQRYHKAGIVAPRYSAQVRSYSKYSAPVRSYSKQSFVVPKASYRAAPLASPRLQYKQYKYNSSVAARNFAYTNRAVKSAVRVQPAYRNYYSGSRYTTPAYRNYYSGNRVASWAVPYATYRNWDRRHEHRWNNHRYRWGGNSWVIIGGGYADPFYYDDGYYSAPYTTITTTSVRAYDTSDSLGAEVQEALAERGYYHDSIDGDVGPNTRAAIAAYQRDHGLAVTGTINAPLLDSLDLD